MHPWGTRTTTQAYMRIKTQPCGKQRGLWEERGLIDERFLCRSLQQPISDSYRFDGSLGESSLVPPSFDLFSPSAVTPAVLTHSPRRQRFNQM